MKINNYNSPNFGAKLIDKNINIGKITPNKQYEKYDVNFVEIEPLSNADVDAIKNAISTWENDKFGMKVYYAAQAAKNGSNYYKNHNTYQY